jgi:hypothetical protein
MMTDWYQKAIDALQLNGLGERTQEAYVRALRMLLAPQERRRLVAQHPAHLLLRHPSLLCPCPSA